MYLQLKLKNIVIFNTNNDNNNNNGNNISNTGFHLFTSIISSIEIILSSLIFSTLIYYNKRISRVDLLIISKHIFYTFIYSLFLFFSIQKQIYIIDESYNYSTNTISCFYVSLLYELHFAINIEQYKAIRNPCFVFKYMINNKYKISKHFFYSLAISLFVTIFPYFIQSEKEGLYNYFFMLTENDYFDISITKNFLLSPLIILSFLFLLYVYFQIKLFYCNLREKSLLHLKNVNKLLLIANILYLIFAGFLLFMPLFSKYTNVSRIIQVLFYILSISDTYLFILKIFRSGFYYYYLNKTFIGFIFKILCCCRCCFGGFYFPQNTNSLTTTLTTKHTQSIYNFYSYLDYIVEDYILDSLDFILQLITSGLSIVYKDLEDKIYQFKSKNDFLTIEKAAHNRISENNNNSEIKNNIININDISSNSEDNNEEDELSKMSSTYNFFKVFSKNILNDKLENDLFSFNSYRDANIIITPLFVKESIESINLYKINKQEIINSLLSHKLLSLLMTNSKKIFFKQLNNLIIKTYDNKLLIELHTDIKVDNNDQFKTLMKKYFNHLNYSNINTFLCVLLGVFKIQINHLKEILIFVSKNPFIENVPRVFYNYWELMRFNYDKKKFNKLLSSKDGDSFIVSSKDDSFLSLTINNLFQIEDFEFFFDTIKNDIKFLKSISSSQFTLLILYYEFETNKHTSNHKSKDSIFNKGRIKLINDSNSDNKNRKISLSISNTSSDNNSINNNNQNNIINNNLFDDNDKEVFISNENNKKMDDLSEIPYISNESKSLIMKNGFESTFNNFKGILYFRWENVFYQNKNISDDRFYINYVNELIKFFSN